MHKMKIVQFTDGCGVQYKSKSTFLDISRRSGMIRHFFGSGHGKGPADACSGVVKSTVTRAVKGGRIISNAKDLKEFADQKLSRDSDTFKRSFHLVDSSDIKRDGKNRGKVNTVKGTRKLRSVRGMSHGKIATRILSCTCHKCLGLDNNRICLSSEYVTEWTEEDLLSAKVSKRKGRASKNGPPRKKPKKQHRTKNVRMKSPAVVKQRGKRSKKQKKHDLLGRSVEKGEVDPNQKSCLSAMQVDLGPGEEDSKLEVETGDVNSAVVELNIVESPVVEVDFVKVNSPPLAELDYQSMLENLGNSNTLQDLQMKALGYAEKLPDLHSHENFTIVEHSMTVDKYAFEIQPEEVTMTNLYPVRVLGDGNCLPRTGSVMLNGTEDSHVEIRLRIVIELALNIHSYMDSDYLRLGTDISNKRAKNLPTSYVMYSSEYIPGDVITPAVVERTLFKEIHKICHLREFMGIWQIFGLSSVLARPVFSVYPNLGNKSVRDDLNRCILPRKCLEKKPVYIMWSSNRTREMTSQHWIPNHFCPLLKMSRDPDPLLDVSLTGASLDINTSASSEQIEEIITMLFKEDSSEATWVQPQSEATEVKLQSEATRVQPLSEATRVQPLSEATGVKPHLEATRVQPQSEATRVQPQSEATGVQPQSEATRVQPQSEATEVQPRSEATEVQPQLEETEVQPQSEATGVQPQSEATGVKPQAEATGVQHTLRRYQSGSFVAISHGNEIFPAVVDDWPWVTFFTKVKQRWLAKDIRHTVMFEDVAHVLDPPDIEMQGSRIYYNFGQNSN